MRNCFSFLTLICVLGVPFGGAFAQAEPVDFLRDIQPLLQLKCLNCHGSTVQESGLQLLRRDNVLTPNDSGLTALVPGDSGQSELMRRITSHDDSDRMPPEGKPLTPEQIDLVKRWIDAGAEWPETMKQPHWAYQSIQPTLPPEMQTTAVVRNPIDQFVIAALPTDPPLTPSLPAEPAKLLRRVSLDLIGLPPTLPQVESFLADPSPANYERIVDELLQSPHYGEKWARPWLDLARYADSNGFQADQFRDIWPYRDWVVQAMNADLPFDQFTIEQIAGDLLPEATVSQQIATGFHRCTTCNVEAGVDPEENRTNQVADRVNTTGLVWMGTSLECCQCHDHKYDPFTMQDYYQIFAFFNNTPLEVVGDGGVQFEVAGPKIELPRSPEKQLLYDRTAAELSDVQTHLQHREEELQRDLAGWFAALGNHQAKPEWQLLAIDRAESKGKATLEVQDDGSLLASGALPDKDEYQLTVTADLTDVTLLKLECLADDRLPGKGPGRGSADRPNFVLYEFSAQRWLKANDSWEPLVLKSAQAEFEQKNYPAAGLIDGVPTTAWAIGPRFGESHAVVFALDQPLVAEGTDPISLRITLPQHFGGARTIGKLRLSAFSGDPTTNGLPPEIAKLTNSVFANLSAEQQRQLADYRNKLDADLSKLRQRTKKLEAELASLKPDSSPVMVELNEPRTTYIMRRGNFLDHGAIVKPDTPAALPPLTNVNGDRPTRLDFARWLVAKDNPLTARVAVNRWWAEFFGRGLVTTLEDFGTQGEPPTHAPLLDWLAFEFMENGWSMKHMHKLIVMSATYQQDSRVTSAQLELDPSNRWLARASRFRLPAETIRDNALAISGLLSHKQGGPPVYPPQPDNIWRHVGRNEPKYNTDEDEDRYRRGIYVVWRRSAPYPSFVNFDAPDRGSCVVQRSRTNTSLQALTLLNDPTYVEMAQSFARTLVKSPAASDAARLNEAVKRTLGRPATTAELSSLQQFLNEESSRLQSSPELAAQLVPPEWRADDVDLPLQAAWFSVANILLNLDETISRN